MPGHANPHRNDPVMPVQTHCRRRDGGGRQPGGLAIRVRGIVQGVGFRPAVWRLTHELDCTGYVQNDGDGALIRLWDDDDLARQLIERLRREAPPLARIDSIAVTPGDPDEAAPDGFAIRASRGGAARTPVSADAATCDACLADSFDPAGRRYRYPLTNCTQCGPRFSIARAIPWDRANTSMAAFDLCTDCAREYRAPSDRRFHAQPNACPRCGPRLRLERYDGEPLDDAITAERDAVDACSDLLRRGAIVAIKGLGGYHLACDAGDEAAVARLRRRKRRPGKPFALMARDLDMICAYARVDAAEAALLTSRAAPIVLLRRRAEATADRAAAPIAAAVAPGQRQLGFLLPHTPLHHLLLQNLERPIVLTSGNLSADPPIVDDAEAAARLGAIADYRLWHERAIINRVDDSVARVSGGEARLLRRARGYAPAPLPLPPGFAAAPPILALGAELKSSFCLLRPGEAILSQHIGDLENAASHADYRHQVERYGRLFEHRPDRLAADLHDGYLSTRYGVERAAADGLALERVQHHHAHVAACLGDNARPLDAPPALGVALDGLGLGDDGRLWGGEFLLADYRGYRRLGCFKPVALPGGTRAILEPWRNCYAQLLAAIGWAGLKTDFAGIELLRFFEARPHQALAKMIASGVNSPPASSCGRLFDAVGAALGLARDAIDYEGQAALELEALVDPDGVAEADPARDYTFAIEPLGNGLPCIEPRPMWRALLGDLRRETPPEIVALRFHRGLATIVCRMVERLAGDGDATRFDTVALSGGVFQNRVFGELVEGRLGAAGYRVLVHRRVPANDGGIAFGQALIAAARAPATTTGDI